MAQFLYTATFADGTKAERKFARNLTHAYRVTYAYTANPSGEVAVKVGFSSSHELATKATKLAKRYTVKTVEIVDAIKGGMVESAKAPKKAKAIKPFAAGDLVEVKNVPGIIGTVAKVGRLYVYITLPGFKTARKYTFADASKYNPTPDPIALAA